MRCGLCTLWQAWLQLGKLGSNWQLAKGLLPFASFPEQPLGML